MLCVSLVLKEPVYIHTHARTHTEVLETPLLYLFICEQAFLLKIMDARE